MPSSFPASVLVVGVLGYVVYPASLQHPIANPNTSYSVGCVLITLFDHKLKMSMTWLIIKTTGLLIILFNAYDTV